MVHESTSRLPPYVSQGDRARGTKVLFANYAAFSFIAFFTPSGEAIHFLETIIGANRTQERSAMAAP
jgi:hypothetical protein